MWTDLLINRYNCTSARTRREWSKVCVGGGGRVLFWANDLLYYAVLLTSERYDYLCRRWSQSRNKYRGTTFTRIRTRFVRRYRIYRRRRKSDFTAALQRVRFQNARRTKAIIILFTQKLNTESYRDRIRYWSKSRIVRLYDTVIKSTRRVTHKIIVVFVPSSWHYAPVFVGLPIHNSCIVNFNLELRKITINWNSR